MKKPNYFTSILKVLHDLHKLYPHQNLGRHLDLALSEYPSLDISDKELLYALETHKEKLEIENPIASDSEVDQIIRETDRIFTTGLEDEEEDF